MVLDILLSSPILIGIVVSVLLLLDIKLTQYGYSLASDQYQEYFNTQQYEMNPRYQDIIHNQKKIPIKIYLVRLLMGAGLASLVFITKLPIFDTNKEMMATMAEFVVGAFILLYLMINLNHLTSIYTFNFINNNPDALEGRLEMSKSYTFATTRRNYFTFVLVWLAVYILTLRIFFLGGVVEQILLIFFSYRWEEQS